MTRADIGEYDILLIGKGYFPDDEVAFIDDKGNVKTWAMFKKVCTQYKSIAVFSSYGNESLELGLAECPIIAVKFCLSKRIRDKILEKYGLNHGEGIHWDWERRYDNCMKMPK